MPTPSEQAELPQVPCTDAPLAERYRQVRAVSDWLTADLSPEDTTVQSMPDASPAKWHLAHTTWFFETFVLEPGEGAAFRPFHDAFRVLFNSYYNGIGAQHPRPERGMITRPSLGMVRDFRGDVDERMQLLLQDRPGEDALKLVELGLHHEQQHQELLLMDIKHLFSCNPLGPAYRRRPLERTQSADESAWLGFPGGVVSIGHAGDGFHFDNETPRHEVLLRPFEIASRPVTNREYLQFVEADGYRDPLLWLADGWELAQREGWNAPLYWRDEGDGWSEFTLAGRRPLDPEEPVCHVSYYEAAAYAQWRGVRLPCEAEWETAARDRPVQGHFMGQARLHPRPARGGDSQMFGDVWEWTRSAYCAYPGFRPAAGPIGEYNGKFMCNQQVLRGGCCVTPETHVRLTYRNFFYPHMRWQFAGIRLARDAD